MYALTEQDLDQIQKIIDILGTPSSEDLAEVKQDRARKYLLSLPPKPKIPFSKLYPHANAAGMYLLV